MRSRIVLILAVLVHANFLLSLRIGHLNWLFSDALYRYGQGCDFFTMYQAGRHLLNGRDVYEMIGRGPLAVPYCYNEFRYLPVFAYTLAVGFNLVPAWPSYWAWIGINEALLGVCILLTCRLCSDPSRRAVGAALWLCYSPYYLELFMGQFSFCAASLMFVSGYFWLRHSAGRVQREHLALAAWTASLCVKPIALALCPVFLRYRKYRAMGVCLAVVAGLSMAYFAFMGSSPANLWRHASLGLPHSGNLGLRALLTWVDNWAESAGVSLLGALFAGMNGALPWAVVGLSLWLTWRPGSDAGFAAYAALWITAYLMIGPDVWEHHYVLLLPALVLLHATTEQKWPAVICALVALPSLFVLFNGLECRSGHFSDPLGTWPMWQIVAYQASKPYAAVIAYAMVARTVLTSDRSAAQACAQGPRSQAAP